MKNIEKKEKKTFVQKIFKPVPKKAKDIFTKIGLISFVVISIIGCYMFHWLCGLFATLSLCMGIYYILCPYKVENENKVVINVKNKK